METIESLLKNAKDLPTAPQVLPKLLEILQDERSTLEDVSDLISFDPALTARLLTYCNSALFAGAEPVTNVPEAIGRAGFNAIRLILTAACASTAFDLHPGTGVDAGSLWKHSLLTAFGSKFVGESAGADGNMLFTAGLLHDVGCIVLARAKGAAYGQIFARAELEKVPVDCWEKSVYGFTHADVGARLLEFWKLPTTIVECVRYHHNPPEAGPLEREATCICVGNILARTLEHPLSGYGIGGGQLLTSMEFLGMTSQLMSEFSLHMQENWRYVNAMLRGGCTR